MAITDVPDAPLSTGGDATLTDCLPLCCLSCHACFDALHGSEDGRVGASLVDDEPVADLVAVLHVLGKFVHGPIIGTGQAGTEVMEDTLSGVTRTQAMGSPDVRR